MKRYQRQYNIDGSWSEPDVFDNLADLYIEVDDMWHCEEFSMELETWCEQASVGDVYEDEDIRVTVIE